MGNEEGVRNCQFLGQPFSESFVKETEYTTIPNLPPAKKWRHSIN